MLRWRWTAPDGSAVEALLLSGGYYSAAFLPPEPSDAAAQLIDTIEREHAGGADFALLMNGFDHMQPDMHVGAVCAETTRR